MKPRTLLNLLLLAALLALALLAVYEPGLERTAPRSSLTTLDPASVTRIQVDHPGQQRVVLVRQGAKQWQMQAPYDAPANAFVSDNLHELLAVDPSARYAASEVDLVEAGLAPPMVTLLLQTPSGDAATLAFGVTDPVHGNRYLRIDDTVALVADYLTISLTAPAAELVNHALLPADAGIEGLQLPALPASAAGQTPVVPATPARQLMRTDSGWTLQPPPTEPLSGAALGGLAAEWRRAHAQTVQAIGPQPSIDTINVDLGKNTLHFEVIGLTPQLVLARPDLGVAYLFSAYQAQRLLRPEAHQPSETTSGPE